MSSSEVRTDRVYYWSIVPTVRLRSGQAPRRRAGQPAER